MNYLTRCILSRALRSDEAVIAQSSLESLRAYYQGHTDDAKALLSTGDMAVDSALDQVQLAAWTMLANELMNLDEVLNK